MKVKQQDIQRGFARPVALPTEFTLITIVLCGDCAFAKPVPKGEGKRVNGTAGGLSS
jgi:hypothetical protein